MLELGRTLKDFQNQVEASRDGFREGWEGLQKAAQLYNEAKRLREEELQETLEKNGLAVCCDSHSGGEQERLDNPSEEQLGIYPLDQMRFHYFEDGPSTVQGEYHDSTRWTRQLDLLCPKHFPQDQGDFSEEKGGHTYRKGEVVRDGGRFILRVDGSDITELVEKGGVDINPNGEKPFLISKEVYRHFGIPDLPEEPKYDKISRS
jgi:hypothetical protein